MATSSDAPVALVTGCATGIGLSAVKLLVSRGYRVLMADWNYEKIAEESVALGSNTFAVRCDVSDWESQVAAFDKAIELWGRVDVVGANAGLPEQVPLLFDTGDVPKKPTTIVVDVDLVGVIYSVNLALHHFRKHGSGRGGRIVITSSQVGIHAFPTGPIYGAAKAGRVPPHIITPMENHMKAWTEFIETDIYGYVYEVDAGGLYNRTAPEYWSPEHQSWLGAPETQEMWRKVGTLGAADVEK
ncbi:unnamed protein product [Parascedosporium putredinis]|uniref:Uncharacterized protein n=1 Tax=Parascedosporium putredinis TaxID=1442378 RepID=A0A9P1H133_9PEZI|nr:unnamed protein product [Parascedosporium putredinis]CAI7992350.1 unnamed protein product [Parascedosporium putredinis]